MQKIPNITLLPIKDGELCCGSAGSYNIEQPDIARELGKQKAENILATEADVVVTGNTGCLIQIRAHLNKFTGKNGGSRKTPLVLHTIEIIDKAYRNLP